MRKVFLASIMLIAGVALMGCTSDQNPIEPTPTPLPTAVKPTFTVQRGTAFRRRAAARGDCARPGKSTTRDSGR